MAALEANLRPIALKLRTSRADMGPMNSTYPPEADPLKTQCPVCYAHRGVPCPDGAGRSHSAREALRIAEIEACLDNPPEIH